MTADHQIVAGFMPLLDSAILVAAKEKGFAAAEGIDLVLVRETSWANIRDRMAVGHFQVAHVLAPMPIASNLGLTPLAVPTIAPMALGLGGNAVTVSNALWARMVDAGRDAGLRSGDDGRGPASRSSAERAAASEACRCALPSCIPTPAITTSCAIGSRPAASIRHATSRSSSCRRR